MGGCGSGRHWHFGAKDTTDDYRALDVRRWHPTVWHRARRMVNPFRKN